MSQFNTGQSNQQLVGYGLQPVDIHYVASNWRDGSRVPEADTACGSRLYGTRVSSVPTYDEFIVHPIAASGTVDKVTCVACLRALARKGGAK